MKKARSKKRIKLYLLWAIAVLITALATLAVLELTHTTSFFSKDEQPIATVNQETKGEPKTPNPGNKPVDLQEGEGSATPQKNGDTPTSETVKLLQPDGTLVSNHRASLSGKGMDEQQSSCTTTPGATCEIIFKKGDTERSLPAKTTDAGGGAYWQWKLKDIGITAGTWKVSAVAKLGDQTQTKEDAMNLEVRE